MNEMPLQEWFQRMTDCLPFSLSSSTHGSFKNQPKKIHVWGCLGLLLDAKRLEQHILVLYALGSA